MRSTREAHSWATRVDQECRRYTTSARINARAVAEAVQHGKAIPADGKQAETAPHAACAGRGCHRLRSRTVTAMLKKDWRLVTVAVAVSIVVAAIPWLFLAPW